MTQITGSDGNGVVHVNARKRLDTSSMSDSRIYYIARDDRKAFSAEYDGMTIVQNDIVAQLKNTSSGHRTPENDPICRRSDIFKIGKSASVRKQRSNWPNCS